MTTTANNPTLARLQDLLQKQTAEAVADLVALDDAIFAAFLAAEQAAEARVGELAAEVARNAERRLDAFRAGLDAMAGRAIADVLSGLEARLDDLAGPTPPAPAPVNGTGWNGGLMADLIREAAAEERQAEDAPPTHQDDAQDAPPAEATPEPAEMAETPRATAGEQEQADPEEARCEVAAQAVEADDDLAVLADPDDDPDGPPCALPLTASPEGLHERQERDGRRAKYTPAGRPEAGGVYWLRDHRRHWQRVVFQPAE